MPQPAPRRVLIIGATSALAHEVAKLHAAAGDRLYLIARNAERLAAVVHELRARTAVVGYACADLSELDRARALVDQAHAALGGLDHVLIAHGYLGDQLRSEHELAEAVEIFEVNLLSAVALLIPLGERLAARANDEAPAPHLGVITSVAGERGRPRNYTYGAAKGGLTRYLEGMRSVLGPQGVYVHNLKLGPVDTPMTVDHPKSALFADAPSAARTIYRAMRKRRYQVYVPGYWRWIMWVVRGLPEWLFQRFDFLSGR